MSQFTRINTRRERNGTHLLLIETKKVRSAQRKKSLWIWAEQAIRNCTSLRVYLTGYRNSAKGLKSKQKLAWHCDKENNPHKPLTNGRDFTEIVLDLEKFPNSAIITIELARVSYLKKKGIHEPVTKFILLGKIIILTPETQKGRCTYGLGVDFFSQERINLLLGDLGIQLLNSSSDINAFSEKFPVIEGITKHDIYFLGKCVLN